MRSHPKSVELSYQAHLKPFMDEHVSKTSKDMDERLKDILPLLWTTLMDENEVSLFPNTIKINS